MITTLMQTNINMSDVEMGDSSAFQKRHYYFALNLLVIIVFYSVPAVQLAYTYQRVSYIISDN